MSLRSRAILATALVSLGSAAVFSVSLLFVVRSSMRMWENDKLERGIEVAVSAARTEAEQAAALQAFRTYHELQAVRGLVEQRVVMAGLGFGLVVFLLSLAVSSFLLSRVARPLGELTRAIEQAGSGDLSVKVRASSSSEVGAVTQAFNRMTERLHTIQDDLRQAERVAAWRDVARVLCHELRNPLTPMRLAVERLQQKQQDRSADLAQVIDRSCRTVLEEITGLDRIVTEFSDFARLPKPRRRPVRLNRLLEDIVVEYAAGSGARLEFKPDPQVDDWVMDPELVRRAVANLVKNSVEALAGKAGRVTVSSSLVPPAAAGGEQQVAIRVEDDGPGVSPALRARLFEPYVTDKPGGTGLGLAVVHQVARSHGGSVSVEPAKGQTGTRFVMRLPRGEEDESETAGS